MEKLDGVFSGRVPTDWRERFVRAYGLELQAWLDAVTNGTATGPNAWDGYAATFVSYSGRVGYTNRTRRDS